MAGPVMGGALLAHTMAGLLDSRQHLSRPRLLFAPFSVDAQCGQTLSRFYQQQVKGGASCSWTTCGTRADFARCAELIRGGGGTVIATAAEIYDRMESIVELDVPNYPLAEQAPDNYVAASCPLCKSGVPISSFKEFR